MFVPKSVFFSLLCRHLSTLPRLPSLSRIPWKYKPQAIKQAQQALTDYLHSTSSIPYTYAEHISKNSLVSLSNLIAGIQFSPSTFSNSFQKFLRYHPINEFEFFYESIGINHNEVSRLLPTNKFFFSEDGNSLEAACALSAFGFPWNKLGNLCKEDTSVLNMDSQELTSRLHEFKEYGFSSASVAGICMAFPCVLTGDLGGEVSALFDDLKSLFLDFELGTCIDDNVDAWYDTCQKIQVFYDLNCKKGQLGELMGKSKSIFLDHPIEIFMQKAQYLCKLSSRKEDVGLLILSRPEILSIDLESSIFSVEGLLKHFGLSAEELESVAEMYPYVLGRNKMANLPSVMRAMDLHKWFFDKIKDGNCQLLATYAMGDPDEDLDKIFSDSLEKIQSSRTPFHTSHKLDFMHAIGFGANALTIKVLAHLHGTSSELQERFECLLHAGIEFSSLCRMIRTVPKILNQKPEMLQHKLDYLCKDMKSSLQYLYTFPAFLLFNLENRIKPRYRFHTWLVKNGWCTKEYSIASIVATSEKSYVARLHRIHPDAPKHWLKFSLQEDRVQNG